MNFTDKFVGFVDILGFTELGQAAESSSGKPLSELMDLRRKLGLSDPCPHSKYVQQDLDFQITLKSAIVRLCRAKYHRAINKKSGNRK